MLLKSLAILCLASLVACQPNTTELFEHSAVLDPGEVMHLYWNFDETSITFELHGLTTGWIGVGISPSGSMVDADIYAGWVKDGVPILTDRHGDSFNGFPPLDREQNAELLEGFEMDGWTVIKFRRLLVACDSEDRDITGDTLRIIFAWNDNDPIGDDLAGYHGDMNRGVKSLMLLEPARTDESMFPEGERHLTFELRNDNLEVPPVDTYYNCRLLKMPELSTKHHLVKVEPIVQEGHELNIHHILVYQCTDDADISTENVDHECYQNNMPPDYASCQFVVMAWAIGSAAFHYPKHTGFPLGVPGAPKYVVVEMHYDNPSGKAGIVDSSGLRIYYTPDLRQYDAGIMEVGHIVNGYQDIIPPNAESFLDVGECSSNCLGSHIQAEGHDSINVFGVLLHSHLLGREIELKHIRNGTELPRLASDSSYDFNLQEARFLAEERVIAKGDAMQIICNYNSQGRKDVTMGGLSTSEEMCLAFVYYYPKLPLTFCQSAPSWYSVMTYFGITEFKYIDDNGVPSLHDFMVVAPPELANKTAYEVVNANYWGEVTADRYSFEAKNMIQQQLCASTGPVPPELKTFIAPLKIDFPYTATEKNCTETSTMQPTTTNHRDTTATEDGTSPSTTITTTPGAHVATTVPGNAITTTNLGAVVTTSGATKLAGGACSVLILCLLASIGAV